jgi:hypothetical protein
MNSAHIALAALLYARCGRGLIAVSDLEACARSLPDGVNAAAASLAHALIAEGLLTRATERAWSLSVNAIQQLSLGGDELSLTVEEEHQLFMALQQRASGGTLGRADLHAVTRRFLEEVLAGAMIPEELLEQVVAAYMARGKLTMSHDGGRYTITMT